MGKGKFSGSEVGIFAALVIVLVGLYLIQSNATWHARLQLLMSGHVFCELHAATDYLAFPKEFPAGVVAWKLVYRSGNYLGYLDVSGHFVPIGSVGFGADRAFLESVVLFYGQIAAAIAVLFLLCRKIAILRGSRRHRITSKSTDAG